MLRFPGWHRLTNIMAARVRGWLTMERFRRCWAAVGLDWNRLFTMPIIRASFTAWHTTPHSCFDEYTSQMSFSATWDLITLSCHNFVHVMTAWCVLKRELVASLFSTKEQPISVQDLDLIQLRNGYQSRGSPTETANVDTHICRHEICQSKHLPSRNSNTLNLP